ncbi:phage tail protein [Salmonella enterica subsp. enterica serovar Anatum]
MKLIDITNTPDNVNWPVPPGGEPAMI